RLLLAPGSGSPLAFVHGLHARHRYRVALIDQVLGKFLWGGHFRLPGVAGAEEFRHGSQREIGRCDVVQVRPAQRKGYGDARADAWAVGRGYGGAARAGGVEEDLAVAVFSDERGGADRGVDAFGTGRDRARGR